MCTIHTHHRESTVQRFDVERRTDSPNMLPTTRVTPDHETPTLGRDRADGQPS